MSCGADSEITLYADGLDVASGYETITGGIPKDTQVIGIECSWPEDVSNSN